MSRDYNGLTGQECLELALLQIRKQWEQDGRFSIHQCYHNVELDVELTIASYPREPAEELLKVKVDVGEPPPAKQVPVVTKSKKKVAHPVPDLARELIHVEKKEAPDAAMLATRPEQRASF